MEYRKEIDTTKELADWYDEKYTEMGDGWTTPPGECNAHLDDLGVPFEPTLRLLDVGCGAGHFLAEAEKRVSCDGVDISTVGCHHARQRTKKSIIHNITIEAMDSPAKLYDFIVSLGSLEHIVDLDKALRNIRIHLKDTGKFYFLCPNEKWEHFDQPNERTMTDQEWQGLFTRHGLFVHSRKRWNDSTAFIGGTSFKIASQKPAAGDKLNIGSGQRRFDNAHGWINVDCVSREGQVPDVICDVGNEPIPYPDGSMSMAVLHQVYEHFGLGEGHGLLREIHRSLKPGGSLIITVPDMRVLASRWLAHQIDDYIYFVNAYGAYQGEPGDRHKWGYSAYTLIKDLAGLGLWAQIKPFDWRVIPGADIARDFWILGVEVIK